MNYLQGFLAIIFSSTASSGWLEGVPIKPSRYRLIIDNFVDPIISFNASRKDKSVFDLI